MVGVIFEKVQFEVPHKAGFASFFCCLHALLVSSPKAASWPLLGVRCPNKMSLQQADPESSVYAPQRAHTQQAPFKSQAGGVFEKARMNLEQTELYLVTKGNSGRDIKSKW